MLYATMSSGEFEFILHKILAYASGDVIMLKTLKLPTAEEFCKKSFPLLANTLGQTLVYYHLRMKVEKELVDIFNIHTDNITMLN